MYIQNNSESYLKLTRLIQSYGFNANSLAKILGCSRPTAKAKLDNPERFTVKDLILINNSGHIPLWEMSESLQG